MNNNSNSLTKNQITGVVSDIADDGGQLHFALHLEGTPSPVDCVSDYYFEGQPPKPGVKLTAQGKFAECRPQRNPRFIFSTLDFLGWSDESKDALG